MIISYNKINGDKIDFKLGIVPTFLEFYLNCDNNNNFEIYKYSLDGENIGDNYCPYDKNIKNWIKNNFDQIENIVWLWNNGEEDKIEMINPLKY